MHFKRRQHLAQTLARHALPPFPRAVERKRVGRKEAGVLEREPSATRWPRRERPGDHGVQARRLRAAPPRITEALGPIDRQHLAVSSTVAYDLSNPRVGNAHGGSSKTGRRVEPGQWRRLESRQWRVSCRSEKEGVRACIPRSGC
jgi:hypothetical protein